MPPKQNIPMQEVPANQLIQNGFANILTKAAENGRAALKDYDFKNIMNFSLEEVRLTLKRANDILLSITNSFDENNEGMAELFIARYYPITNALCRKIVPYLNSIIKNISGLEGLRWYHPRRYYKQTIIRNYAIRGQAIGILSLAMLNAIISKDESTLKHAVATLASASFQPLTRSGLKKHFKDICAEYNIPAAGSRIGTLLERLEAINIEQQQFYKNQLEIIENTQKTLKLQEKIDKLKKESNIEALEALKEQLERAQDEIDKAKKSYTELYKKYLKRLTPSEQVLEMESIRSVVGSRDVSDPDDRSGVDSTPLSPVSQNQVRAPFHTKPQESWQGAYAGSSSSSKNLSVSAYQRPSSSSSSTRSVPLDVQHSINAHSADIGNFSPTNSKK